MRCTWIDGGIFFPCHGIIRKQISCRCFQLTFREGTQPIGAFVFFPIDCRRIKPSGSTINMSAWISNSSPCCGIVGRTIHRNDNLPCIKGIKQRITGRYLNRKKFGSVGNKSDLMINKLTENPSKIT